MKTDDIDQTALRLTKLAAESVRALEERKPGCAETNNIGLLGAIRRDLIVERERCAKIASEWLNGPTMLLRAGEMTLQEKRTAMAVVAAIYIAISEPQAEVALADQQRAQEPK